MAWSDRLRTGASNRGADFLWIGRGISNFQKKVVALREWNEANNTRGHYIIVREIKLVANLW